MNKISIGEICKLGVGVALGFLTLKILSYKGQKDEENTSNLSKKSSGQSKKQQEQNSVELENLAVLQQVLRKKSTSFEIQTVDGNQNIFTKKCLLKFFTETQDILDAKQLIQIYEENRQARRQVFPEIERKYETYFRFVCTLDENIKYVLEKAQKDFAVFLNINFDRIMESISYHLEVEENQGSADNFRLQVVEVLAGIRQNLANYLPLFNQPIPKFQLLQILQFQTQILTQQQQFLINLVKKMGLQTRQEQQALPLFLTCYLQDRTWQKYGVQFQQMSVVSQQKDQQLQNRFQKFNNTRKQIIKLIHYQIQDNIIIQQ